MSEQKTKETTKEKVDKKIKKDEKPFDVDDFYRKVGVYLLLLLLVVMMLFGFAILSMQKIILNKTNSNYVERKNTKVIFLDEDNNVINR